MTAVPAAALPLPAGGRIPLLGFGTWELRGETARASVESALEVGYRHLDTATIYENEAEVGAALEASGLAHDEVFVTTKCWPDDAGREREALEGSLDRLGLDAVDLWLVHWPPGNDNEVPMWEAFVAAHEAGLTREIGVSNFSLGQIDEISEATGRAPAVNQVKWSPLLYDAEFLAGHRERGILLEGYSGLRHGTLSDPTIIGIADRLSRTPAQVILRWHLQHEIVAIPRSSKAARVRENADLDDFELSTEDMSAMDRLGAGG